MCYNTNEGIGGALMKQRIKWIDVARCLGIFAIYLGHFGESPGRITTFVYTHHVALFFFISGCLAPREDLPLLVHVKKTIKTLLFPWFVFAIVSAVLYMFYLGAGATEFLLRLKQIALGTIVNEYVAASLWFLVGLAGVKILFEILRKLRYPVIILAVSLALFWVEAVYSIPRYYNLHRVLRFAFFYAAGFFAFPYIANILQPKTKKGRILLTLSGLFSLAFSSLVYYGYNPLMMLPSIPVLSTLLPVATALVIIWTYLITAKILENVDILNRIGSKTLYLCTGEYFAGLIIKCFINLIGLGLTYTRPLCAWICAAITLYVAYRYVTPIEERVLAGLRKFPTWLRQG